ncbi:SAPS protein [Rhizoctonia solani]|uniref:SAPS protein n=1 Tax=Rhizoctonia solani TaxID=456999 RepID=A0A8H7M8B8_9AGAM|nr:SAPS protein [Rhizoctonia solani]
MSMFWRFGFHGTNNIDNLLNQEEVSLEAILDHDDLLSECKQQNPRLIDYLQRPEVLQRLFAYVTGEIVSEGRAASSKQRGSQLDSFMLRNMEHRRKVHGEFAQILAPFWDTVLSMPPDELRTKASVAAHFAKISGTFLMKKPEEVVVAYRVSPFVDLLFRIIQLDESPGNIGVMEQSSGYPPKTSFLTLWIGYLPDTRLAFTLSSLSCSKASSRSLRPLQEASISLGHKIAANGPVTNRFVRELASTNIVEIMVGFMLDEAPFGHPVEEVLQAAEQRQRDAPKEVTLTVPSGLAGPPGIGPRPTVPTPTPPSESTSSQLIRKNNSDYFEPYLFHTLRNRLMQIQQQHLDEMHELGLDMDDERVQEERERERLERGMADMVDHLGIVHLGRFLRILAKRLPDFQELLRRPRSLNGYVLTSVGQLVPLTLERFRIIELYAELLHCSNMSLLNRRRGFGPTYDEHGRLTGGLDALEQLARVIDPNVSSDAMMDQSLDSDTVQDTKEPPASSASTDCSSLTSEDGVSVDDEHTDLEEDLASSRGSTMSASAQPSSNSSAPPQGPPTDAVQSDSVEIDPFSDPESAVGSMDMSTPRTDVSSSNTSTVRHSPIAEHYGAMPDRSAFEPSGDILKQQMIDLNVVSTILDFFFEFPWNNFLHNAVYDLLHQILTGRVDNELSRRVTIGCFEMLDYLLEALSPYVPQPDWDNFVAGQYKETKERDTSQLGGGKPAVSAMGIGIGQSAAGRGIGSVPREVRGGADFGPAEPDDTLIPSDPSPDVTEQAKSNPFDATPVSDEDEDVADSTWASSHHASGDFDLNATQTVANKSAQDPFETSDPITSVSQFSTIFKDEDDDDVSWGPFADPTGPRSSLQPSFDDEDDGFGDFQTSTADSSSSFEDSFNGVKPVIATNLSGQIQEAVDDTMEEPTTPRLQTDVFPPALKRSTSQTKTSLGIPSGPVLIPPQPLKIRPRAKLRLMRWLTQ